MSEDSSMKRLHHALTAQFCHALASPMRLHVLTLLAQGKWSVGQLAAELGESVATVSAHLKVLRAAHLISMAKQGREVWSTIASQQVLKTLAAVQQAAEVLIPEFREAVINAKNDPFLESDADFCRLFIEAEQRRLTLIDLRPEAEYREGHLPHALSYPYDTLTSADLYLLTGENRRIVGYCRGPWCKRAIEGVRMLNERGVPARRLRAGVVEWQAAGLALER